MKIGVILGRGVEGVGLTKNVVEFQKLFPGVEVYATIDKPVSYTHLTLPTKPFV